MKNEKIICSECNTENEDKYNYCKNCGNKLKKPEAVLDIDPLTGYPKPKQEQTVPFENKENPIEEATKEKPVQNNSEADIPPYTNNYNQNQYQANGYNPNPYIQNAYVYGNTFVENIDDIPYGEVAVFVGKKADKYMPVFSKMEITSSKINWHWPVALLGFFLGPLGVAIWYFFRKMYKHAIVFAAIGAALTVISSLLIAPSANSFTPADLLDALSGDITALESLTDETSVGSQISSLLTDVADFACAILCALFTHGWYKKHIHRSIMKYRYSNVDPRYYQMGLASLGGTSGGMLALGIGIMIFAENFASFILILKGLIGG